MDDLQNIKTNKMTLSLMLFALVQLTSTSFAAKPVEDIETQHQRAVDLARGGEHDKGLNILSRLLKAQPDNYSVRRDYVVIATWKNDCDTALANYEKIRKQPKQENYLIMAVSECLKQKGKDQQAYVLLKKAVKENPNDKELKQAYNAVQNDIKLATSPAYTVTVGNNNSDGGNRDWFLDAIYSQQLKPRTRWYLHYYKSKAVDSQFQSGDLNRLGFGLIHQYDEKWVSDVELFAEVGDGTGSGYRVNVTHYYDSLLTLVGEYNSNSSEIPLRAKALDIETDRLLLSADYHTPDYRWEMYASISRYDFTDRNNRLSLYGAAGYAYKMQPKLEHRVILGLSRSKNSLNNTVYFNPESDMELSLTHKTTYVHDSKYQRHVDNLYISLGNYKQKGFSVQTTYGLRYEQAYDIDDRFSFNWGAGYARRAYDGVREGEWSVLISISGKLD